MLSGGAASSGSFFLQELSITAAKLVYQVKGVSGMTAVKDPGGDRLEDLMRRYGDALVRMCCLYLNDASLAQDAAQDTFIKAWRNLGQFRGECDERTWLMRIAINTCRDYHRTAWLRHVDRGTPLEALPEVGAEDAHPDGEVIRAVTALPRREREAVLLRYYQEMTIAEAAQALRISQSAVKQRLQRANRRLRDRLKEWYYDA